MKKFVILSAVTSILLSSCATMDETTKCTLKINDKGEITLKRSEKDNFAKLTLETSDPVALRTLLMQGFKLLIYGETGDTTYVVFPSAMDVADKLEHHPSEVKAMISGDGKNEKRPDIRPLVGALREADVQVNLKEKTTYFIHNAHDVAINPANGVLSYSAEIPYEYIVAENYVVTLISEPEKAMKKQNEFAEQRPQHEDQSGHEQPFGVNRSDYHQQNIIKLDFDFNLKTKDTGSPHEQ